jgi:hypothetical protein
MLLTIPPSFWESVRIAIADHNKFRLLDPNPDPDPVGELNADPCGSGSGSAYATLRSCVDDTTELDLMM